MKERANETERVGNHVARMEKGNWNREKNVKSAARGEIAIESSDEKLPQRQEETRVALPKDPYHRRCNKILSRSIAHGARLSRADFFARSISR